MRINKTFGNSKLNYIYSIVQLNLHLTVYKYKVINKSTETKKDEVNGKKETNITLELKLVEFMFNPINGSLSNKTITVDASSDHYVCNDNKCHTHYFCNRIALCEYIKWTKPILETSLNVCYYILMPNKYLKIDNIFKDAKAGDLFETIDGRIAHYLFKFYANYDVRPEMEYHQVFIEGMNYTVNYKSNGEANGSHCELPKIIRKIERR